MKDFIIFHVFYYCPGKVVFRMKIIKVFKTNSKESEIRNNKIKVAAYCRVSSGKETQESSYYSQIEWYNELIRNNPE